MHICVYYVYKYICMFTKCVGTSMYVGVQWTCVLAEALGWCQDFLGLSPSYALRQGLLIEPEACWHSESSLLACSEDPLSPPPECLNDRWPVHIFVIYFGVEDLNPSPYTCTASTLLAETPLCPLEESHKAQFASAEALGFRPLTFLLL